MLAFSVSVVTYLAQRLSSSENCHVYQPTPILQPRMACSLFEISGLCKKKGKRFLCIELMSQCLYNIYTNKNDTKLCEFSAINLQSLAL